MNGYEKIIKMMQKAGGKQQKSVALGIMQNESDCKIGDLILDSEDYLIAERLQGKLKKDDTVVVLRHTEETYIIIEKVV